MATWRKVIVSGSTAELNGLTLSGDLTVTGGDITLGATSIFSGGDTAQLNNIDALDATTEATIESAIDTLSNLTAASSLVTVSTLSTGAISSGFGNIDIGTSTLNAGNSTVDTFSNDSAVGSSKITGSFTGSFVGDGSSLTGVAQDIDSLGALGGATLHQTQDFFHFSDNGTEKKITFNNICDSLYADVSGDILIAAGGAATIQADSVALGTDTTGNYVGTLSVGAGMAAVNADGEGSSKAIAVDGVLEDLDALAACTDAQFIVGTGAGTFGYESTTTARTSLGVGTGDSPQFTAVNIGAATDTTIARSGAGDITVEGNHIYRVGGTDVVVADGGTGRSALTSGYALLGNGTGTVQMINSTADSTMLVGNATTMVAESGATLRTSIGVAIGTDVQAYDAQLADVAGLAVTDSGFIVGNGSNFVLETGNTLRTSMGVGTGDSPSFTDLTLSGDLTVNGDLTYLNTSNLLVKDQFIYAASGSSDVDGGLIVGGTTVGSGSALYWDKDSDRWSTQESVAQNATTVTPNQFVVTTTVHATDDPGSSDGDYGVGEMWIAEDTDDIWIRTG